MNRLQVSLLRSSPRGFVAVNVGFASIPRTHRHPVRRGGAPPDDGETAVVATIVASSSSSSFRSSSSSALPSSSWRGGVGGGRPTTTTTPTTNGAAATATATGPVTLHIPVMREEVLRLWLPDGRRRRRRDGDAAGVGDGGDDGDGAVGPTTVHLIDGTMGLGGHTRAALHFSSSSSSSSSGGITREYEVRVLGIDRDASSLSRARRRIEIEESPSSSSSSSPPRVAYHHGSFADVSPDLLRRHSFPPGGADGMLIDLGMNSDQIDDDERGFTFRKRGPLDMRFDKSSSFSPPSRGNDDSAAAAARRRGSIKAGDIVNGWSASRLSDIFKTYADEPYAVEIAAGIVRWRESSPRGRGEIRSTLELRYVIEDAVEGIVASNDADSAWKGDDDKYDDDAPKKWGKKDDFERYRGIWRSPIPVSKLKRDRLLFKYEERKPRHPNHVMRCFQALRIAANEELRHIESLFELMLAPSLSPPPSSSASSSIRGCPLAIGGRLVAIAFHPGEDRLVKEGMARMVDTGRFELLTPEEDGLRPSLEEVKSNGRSRTARLRAVECIR
jgi:16S rRNA C1402 N4-methylase RsmH